MSFAHILNVYININLLVIAGFLSMVLYQFAVYLNRKYRGSGVLLKLHYAVIGILFCLIFSYPLLPERKVDFPSVRIWSTQTEQTYTGEINLGNSTGIVDVPGVIKSKSFDIDSAKLAIAGFIIFLFSIGVIKISSDLRKLYIIKKGSYRIRKFRSVSIYANDSIKIPFSYWLPGSANIIIPTDLIGKPKDYKITIYHELQHHRNGDTKWVYAVWLLKTICLLNPCIHLWNRLISELQEFACDEVLVDRKKINSQDYASCLVEAAKSASDQRRAPVCATGLTLMVQRQLLKRRIERMFIKTPIQLKWQINLLIIILITWLMISISCASKGAIKDDRVTMDQAVVMAEKAKADTDYPIVVNDRFLKELNAYLGTPEGREYIRGSLDRMESFAIQDEIKMIWPIKGWISDKFGYRTSPFTGEKEFHTGTDISTRSGTPIVAAADGYVSFVGKSNSFGNYITLSHGYGYKTRYGHLRKILVKKGQAVKTGDTIATCGNTGLSTGPHLHFELWYDKMPINPEAYLKSN